jgi:hypothetical protein
MDDCPERERLERALMAAREKWYGLRDLLDQRKEYEEAEKRVRNLQNNLSDHLTKHKCARY